MLLIALCVLAHLSVYTTFCWHPISSHLSFTLRIFPNTVSCSSYPLGTIFAYAALKSATVRKVMLHGEHIFANQHHENNHTSLAAKVRVVGTWQMHTRSGRAVPAGSIVWCGVAWSCLSTTLSFYRHFSEILVVNFTSTYFLISNFMHFYAFLFLRAVATTYILQTSLTHVDPGPGLDTKKATFTPQRMLEPYCTIEKLCRQHVAASLPCKLRTNLVYLD